MFTRLKFTLCTALLAATLLTGCGGQDNQQTGSASTPAQPGTKATSADPNSVQYASCLRSRGVDVDDPEPGQPVELPQKDEKTRAALRACAAYAPQGVDSHDRAGNMAAGRAYASCMRNAGFPDFPDPDERGIQIPKSLIDDPKFKEADRRCGEQVSASKDGK